MTDLVPPATLFGLSGYCLPLSPAGQSSMVPPPPWHFSGDVLWVDYRVDPASAAAFLPAGLSPGADPGAAALAFFDWQWCTDSGAELRDPVRAQFRECTLLLGCEFDGRPVVRVPFAWVDDPVPLVRGLFQGLSKTPGTIRLTRAMSVGRAGPRRAAGGQFSATLSAYDRRLLDVHVTLTGPAAEPPVLNTRMPVHLRHFPAWDPAGEPVSELVSAASSDHEYSAIWRGSAEIDFAMPAGSEIAALAPVEIGTGYVFSYGETLAPGQRLTAGHPG